VTPDEHFVHFAEFVRGVELAGGTTPHVAMTVESMSRLDDNLEKLWFAGCYALTYNWPAAERLFLEVRPDEAPGILPWLEEHWDGIPLRKERKSVYRKWAFAESASAYAACARYLVSHSWEQDYEEAFRWFNANTRYMGRYIAIRWLEVMRRAFPDRCAGWVMPSILSDGGQHSRKALALIYPGYAQWLLGGNTPGEIKISDSAVEQLKTDLELEYGLKTNYYEMQSLTCEYKQAVLSRRHYPGKSIDTEMGYLDKVRGHWGLGAKTDFFDVRRAVFPSWSLGEDSGWWGVRPELGSLIADHGLVWSDAVYDYGSTTDFSNPVPRDPSRVTLL
jgi:hypothetical protein